MRWSADVYEALTGLRTRYPSELPSGLRVLMEALLRAEAYAANKVLSFLEEARPRQGTRWDYSGGGGWGRPAPEPPALGWAPPLRMLLIKPAGDVCNLACRYCYESVRREGSARELMSHQTLRRIHEHVLPFVKPPFLIYYHGGEPLLRGRAFFREAVRLRNEMRAPDEVQVGVQTNATLVDEAWARFFADHDLRVGVSLDGPPAMNELRVTGGGRASYDMAVRGIRQLQEVGIQFGTIAVLTPWSVRPGAAAELLHHFHGLGIREFDVHPAFSAAPGSDAFNLSAGAYTEFMVELFEAWLTLGDDGLQIRTFEHFFQGMTGVRAGACYRAGQCTTILGVDPGGEVIPCTRPFDPRYRFGNLARDPLPRVAATPAFREFVAGEAEGRARTKGCEWAHLCGDGGCPHERRADGRQAVEGWNVYCTCREGGEGGYPGLFRHLRSRSEDLLLATSRVGAP